ncbi:MAG: MlaD family protein [Pirellulaceae bacterium]|nr:MlaD family protein [Pirellulaceae bacterium]
MNERVIQFRIGIVVVAAVIMTAVLLMLFQSLSLFKGRYTVTIKFPEASGVVRETPVRKSGIRIGYVSRVELLETGGVNLTLRIDNEHRLKYREACRVGTGSLVAGDAVVEFVPPTNEFLITSFDRNGNGQIDSEEEGILDEYLSDGDYLLNGTVAIDPMSAFVVMAGDIPAAARAVEAAGEEIANLARTVNSSIGGNEGELKTVIGNLNSSLLEFRQMSETVNELIGDPATQAGIRQALEGIPQFFEDAGSTMDVARQTLEKFQNVGVRAEANLANLEDLTAPLAEHGPELVDRLGSSLANVDAVLEQLALFSESLNNQDGTLGMLIHDDEVYERLNRTIGNIETLSRRIDPILFNVRVFTDKIARDPRQLGVQGALDQRPPGVGLKTLTPRR